MPPSYRKIDYSLRPAKHTERRMLSDVFARLSSFDLLQEYAYSGMGSVWFSDFLLLHRQLGLRHMTSMEWPRGSRDRIIDNVPLKNIRLIHKAATQAIPELDWSRRQIVWLDYDGLLTPSILIDVAGVAERARSGSVLAVSLQCNSADEVGRNGGADPVTLFTDAFRRERVGEIEQDDLYGWNFAAVCRRLVIQEIEGAIALRNVMLPAEERMHFDVLCGFEYADDAKMTTVVIAFHSHAERELFSKCSFDKLDLVSAIGDIVRIEMPNLTLHEMRWLQRQLPSERFSDLDLKYIPESEAARYARLYRYFPNFAVLES